MKNEIIKKINDYYGYRAINRVRFRNTIIHDKVLTKKLTKERNKESQLRKQKKNFSFDENQKIYDQKPEISLPKTKKVFGSG